MKKAVFAGAIALAMMGPLLVSEQGFGPASAVGSGRRRDRGQDRAAAQRAPSHRRAAAALAPGRGGIARGDPRAARRRGLGAQGARSGRRLCGRRHGAAAGLVGRRAADRQPRREAARERPQCAAFDGRRGAVLGRIRFLCFTASRRPTGGRLHLADSQRAWAVSLIRHERRAADRRRAARGAGPRMRHLHAVLQADRRDGAGEAARHVVSALRARERLRHLRDAAGRVPHLLLPLDAGEGSDRGLEAREGEVRAGDERRRAHDGLRRSGLSRRMAQPRRTSRP